MTVDQVRLFPDEHVLWTGDQMRRGRPNGVDIWHIVVIAFAIVFSVFWQVTTWNAPILARALGLLVPVVLLEPVRQLLRRLSGGRRYTLTNQRVVITHGGRIRNTYLRNLAAPSVHRRGDSPTGTIRFDRDTRFSFSTLHTQLKGEERFELIEVADPEVVRDLIASARVSLR